SFPTRRSSDLDGRYDHPLRLFLVGCLGVERYPAKDIEGLDFLVCCHDCSFGNPFSSNVNNANGGNPSLNTESTIGLPALIASISSLLGCQTVFTNGLPCWSLPK